MADHRAKAKNLWGFAISVGLIPLSFSLGLNLYAPDKYSYPRLDATTVYWLLTGISSWAWIVWVLGLASICLIALWISKHVVDKIKLRPSGLMVASAIHLTVFAIGFFPTLSTVNIHASAVQLGGRVYYLSEYKGMQNAGYFWVWECDRIGFVCRAIKAVTLKDYGISRLPETQISLLAAAKERSLDVVVDGQSVVSFTP